MVFRALDSTLNRLVALKVLRSEHSGDPAFVAQFEHEARLTASINHPNVVRVFSFGAIDEHVFLAMELVDGGTLDKLMEETGRIPEAQALKVGIEIAKGLRAGFEKGLVHRDVKPGNMLFSADGTAKIVDFGLAVFMEHDAQATGDIWGTPYYLPPERLNRQQEDFRADIYSLGAALFHAIAGRPPFEAEDASHVALKHLRSKAVSIQAFAPDVSNATAYVINRTLLKNPDERQASYDEFIEQLQYALDAVTSGARGGRTAQKSRVVMEDAGAKKMMSRVTLATFAVLLIGLIIGGIVLFKAMRGEDDPIVDGNSLGPVTIESFGPGWAEAKQSLLGKDWAKASAAFAALAEKQPQKSQKRDWAIIHQALAEQFRSGSTEAADVLDRLPDSSTQLRKFFREEIRKRLADSARIPSSVTKEFSLQNHEALGALFLALHDYARGDLDDSAPMFRHFFLLRPDSNVAWLADYKVLANTYHEEASAYTFAADGWTTAQTAPEQVQVQALGTVRALQGKLPKESKYLPKARQLLAKAEQHVAATVAKRMEETAKRNREIADRNKNNLAFKSKATASVSDKNDPPEKAVDGDPATAWNAGGNEKKWLAVDLGSPKKISRWALRLASSADGKPEQNLAAFKLGQSKDGKEWEEVDSVEENRMGIVDRVVREFTARWVRVDVIAGTQNPNEKTARICELWLGAAADQAGAGYAPAQGAAMRFSTQTPFIGGPIGDTDKLGMMQFDEKTGKFTVKGSGADIFGKTDAFQFVWLPVNGDCAIIARVAPFQTADKMAKGGLMIRTSLTKESSHCGIFAVQGGKAEFISRAEQNKDSERKKEVPLTLPRWLKIARQGKTVIGYESADGVAWAEVAKADPVGLGPVAFVGLAVCSRAKGQLATAEFVDVQVQKARP